MNAITSFAMLSLAVVTAVSCGGGETDTSRAGDAAADAAASADSMGAMPGMQGMGTVASAAMIEAMRTHVQTLADLTGEELIAAVPEHRRMLANLIAQMNTEMRDMGMTADPAWTAIVDSLRADLVRLPDLSVQELPVFMPPHTGRVTRLMEMHGRMMRNM